MSAWASKVSSILVAVLVSGTVVTIVLTVGRSAAAEQQVRAQLDQAGARLLVVSDLRGAGFVNLTSVEMIGGLSTVQAVVADGLPFDTRNGALGDGGKIVPAWPVGDGLSRAVELVRGRWPSAGEALVSSAAQSTLGLSEPVGFLTDGSRSVPVVGAFRARSEFSAYATGVVMSDRDTPLRRVQIVMTSADTADVTQSAVLGILDPTDPEAVGVVAPAGLANTATAVGGTVSRYGQAVLGLLLAAGAGAVGVVVGCDVQVRRRDLGRRRTLGITRGDLVALVLLRIAIPATAGVLGGAAGATLLSQLSRTAPASVGFVVATSVQTVAVSVAAAVVPALLAAWRDPVTVLKSP